jgi:hypothetical protein
MKLLLLSLSLSSAAFATDRFCSPSGSGSGTYSSPWSLASCLTDSNISDGDVIYLRGGTYSGAFNSNLTGTSGSRITVRNYPGETATLSFSTCTGTDETLEVTGDYTDYRSVFPGELVIENTCTTRTYSADFRSNGIEVQSGADNNRFIHLVIHDAGMGIVDAGAGNLAYGNVIYNNGKVNNSGDKTNGHGIYPSNPSSSPVYSENLILNNYGFGMHAYGSSITGITVEGNATSRNGLPSGAGITTSQILVNDTNTGGNGNAVTSNYLYMPYGYTLGTSWTDALLCANCADGQTATTISITNNIVMGGPSYITGYSAFTYTGNTFDTEYGSFLFNAGTFTISSLNNNTYRGSNTSLMDTTQLWVAVGVSGFDFAGWKAACSCDAASTYSATKSTTEQALIRASSHDTARANLIIFNRDGNNTASVDISSFATAGQFVTIRNGQNWAAAPVWQGVYAGGSVTIPMNTAPATPYGGSALPADSAFGAFVIFKQTNPFKPQAVLTQ